MLSLQSLAAMPTAASPRLESFSPDGGTSFVVDKSNATTWSIMVTNKNKKFEEFRIYGKKNGLPLYVKSRIKNREVEISGNQMVLREFLKDREVAYVYARNYKNNKYYPMFAKISPLGVFKNTIADCGGCNTGTGESMLPGGFIQLSCTAQAMDKPAVDCKDPVKATQLNEALKKFSSEYALGESMNNGMSACLKKYLPQGNNDAASQAPALSLKSGLSDTRQAQSSCSADSYSSLTQDKSVQWGQDLQKVTEGITAATDSSVKNNLQKQANDVILHEMLHKYIPAFNGSDLCGITQSTDTEEHLLSSCCSGSDTGSCARLDQMKTDIANLRTSIGKLPLGIKFNDATLMSMTVQKAFYTAIKATADAKGSCTADTTGILKSCTVGGLPVCLKPTDSLNNLTMRSLSLQAAGYSTSAAKILTGTSDVGNSLTSGDHNTGEIISINNPIPSPTVTNIYQTTSSRSPSSTDSGLGSAVTALPVDTVSAQTLANSIAATVPDSVVATGGGSSGADVASSAWGKVTDTWSDVKSTVNGFAGSSAVTVPYSQPAQSAAETVVSANLSHGAVAGLVASTVTGDSANAAATPTAAAATATTQPVTVHTVQYVPYIPDRNPNYVPPPVDTKVAPTGEADDKAQSAPTASAARAAASDSSSIAPATAAAADSIKAQLSGPETTSIGDAMATLSKPENKALLEATKVQVQVEINNRVIKMGYTGQDPARIIQYNNGKPKDAPLSPTK